MNRAERIEAAKAHVEKIEPHYQSWRNKYEAAQSELRAAEASYDVGERVRVTETCKRGCCVEHQYEGVVVGSKPNGTWCVKSDDGHVYEYVSKFDMKRL